MLSPVINHFERVADNSQNFTHGNYGIVERDRFGGITFTEISRCEGSVHLG